MTIKKHKQKLTQSEKRKLRKKWKRWLKKIKDDLGELLTSMDVYTELRAIVAENKKIQSPALLFTWISRNFADSVAIGIRRFNDHNKRSISLYRLIEDVSEHPDAITRKFYTSPYPKWMQEHGLADRDFNKFANKKDNILNPDKLKRDMRKLEGDTDHIRKFVNKWVAHCDLKQRKYKIPTFKDVDNTLRDIDQIFCKYYMLLTRAGMTTCKPALQFDWTEPLKHVWIPKDSEKRIDEKVRKAFEAMTR